jgi:5-methylcytosine-specific restriction endonuclease McrA
MIRRKRSTTVRNAIWQRFNKTCQMCFQLTDERGFELDHHIPLEIGGDDSDDNLRPLCRPCHRLKTKGDRTDIAKAHRREANHTGARARQPWPKRPKQPAEPQRRASTPLAKSLPPRRYQ